MPTHSHHRPVPIPAADVWSFLFDRTDREYPDDHVIFSDLTSKTKHTFRDIRNASADIGRGLQTQWNWKKGDVMALFTPNSADIATVTFGTLWAGGIVCPLNNLYTVEELASLLKSSEAKALTTHISCLEVALAAALAVGLPLDRIILIGDLDPQSRVMHFSSLSVKHQTTLDGNVSEKVKINPRKDLAFLVYSSGTTGLPKGVMLSHENIVVNILQCCTPEAHMIDWHRDTLISFLPMFHVYGISAILFLPLYRGVTVHIMQRFNLEQFCSSIEVNKVTVAYLVPPVMLLLAKSPVVDKYNLKSLRMMHCAAAPLSNELIDMAYKRLKVPIIQTYGMSETSPGIASQSWADWDNPRGSVGRPLPSISIKIMSGTKEVAAGQEGEIWIKGLNVFRGYYQNPKATQESIVNGWFRSGDIGYLDEGGNLFLTDRLKELIKYNGFQVAPAQLEGLLLGHEAVEDCAVVGVWDKERQTELPRAYVVVAKGFVAGKELERDVKEWLARKVAPHKQLRGGVRFVDAIPKSAAGKVLRKVLVEQAKNDEEGRRLGPKL